MFLSEKDLNKFDKDGYLFFPEMFNPDEAALLKQEAQRVYSRQKRGVERK